MIAPLTRVPWPTAYRIVPDETPAISAFASVVDPDDLPALLSIEAITNPLARHATKLLSTLSPSEWEQQARSALIMMPFLLPSISRFSDGTYGVFYAGDEWETAAAESAYHRAKDLRASKDPAAVLRVSMQEYSVNVEAEVHDVRRTAKPPPPSGIYDPDDYRPAQAHAAQLRTSDGCTGLLYESVRRRSHDCIGLMSPKAIVEPKRSGTVYFDWDGTRISITRSAA